MEESSVDAELRPENSGWEIWQAQGFASVDGIDGDVDLDVMR